MNDSTNPVNNGTDESHAPVSPGAQLAAYRQERGWTVEQVASQLNLAPRQVVAIESDDYAALPGMAITRGFMRSYAKLLKVDPAPLLAALGGEAVLVHESSLSNRKSLSTPFSEARIPSMAARQDISSKWLLGGLVVILVGVGIWAAQQNGALESISKSATSQVKEGVARLSSSAPDAAGAGNGQASAGAPGTAVETRSAPAADTAASAASSGGAAESDAPAQASAPASASMQAAAPTPGPAPAATEPAAASAAKAASAPPDAIPGQGENAPAAAAKNPLVFTAKMDSWIEVRRTSGKAVLMSRVLKAGETQTIDVSEPLSVVVGNASGVQATLRGAPLEIKSAGGNVARLTVK